VQLTPPGSACSIVIGTGLTEMAPGVVQGLQHTVTDMDAARDALLARGVEVGEVAEMGGFKFASFSDPDGNGWVLREIRESDRS